MKCFCADEKKDRNARQAHLCRQIDQFHQNSRLSSYRSGFSLFEILIAITIIGILGAGVFQIVSSTEDRNLTRESKEELKEIRKALHAYFRDNGRFPVTSEGLSALFRDPGNTPKWSGPYLVSKTENNWLRDAWGRPYTYNNYFIDADNNILRDVLTSDLFAVGAFSTLRPGLVNLNRKAVLLSSGIDGRLSDVPEDDILIEVQSSVVSGELKMKNLEKIDVLMNAAGNRLRADPNFIRVLNNSHCLYEAFAPLRDHVGNFFLHDIGGNPYVWHRGIGRFIAPGPDRHVESCDVRYTEVPPASISSVSPGDF